VVAILTFTLAGVASAGSSRTYDVSDTDSDVYGDAFSDPGLVIKTAFVAGLDNEIFDLENGESHTFDFFKIWTDEGSINTDDLDDQDVTAVLGFDLPPGTQVHVEGSSTGLVAFYGLFQGGGVSWDGPVTVTTSDRVFTVELSDEEFNWGLFGLNDGYRHGAIVEATVTQVSAVPLPSAAWLGFVLLGGIATVRRIRRKK
jgi:hypothetical protein